MEVFIMLAKQAFADNAKVMSKGQITIPKDVREVLGVSNGDRVTFIVEGSSVRIVNSAVYAMQILQKEMSGEAKQAGLDSEEDVLDLINNIRKDGDANESTD
jgi:AbrB family looped-hinge helix DNA binding protein